jgi:hypothetical protein
VGPQGTQDGTPHRASFLSHPGSLQPRAGGGDRVRVWTALTRRVAGRHGLITARPRCTARPRSPPPGPRHPVPAHASCPARPAGGTEVARAVKAAEPSQQTRRQAKPSLKQNRALRKWGGDLGLGTWQGWGVRERREGHSRCQLSWHKPWRPRVGRGGKATLQWPGPRQWSRRPAGARAEKNTQEEERPTSSVHRMQLK